ncbi:MAG: hypothetical protein O3B42_08800 [Actinomycetota bacterium]|nr:hypothetical protein [Actinomycetota bacterium]
MTQAEIGPADRAPLLSRYRWQVTGLAAVLAIVAVASAVSKGEPHVEPIDWGHDASRNVLSVSLSYCGALYKSGAVETDTEISVWIYPVTPIHQGGAQPACADGVQIQLTDPIGNRTVIDGRTGRPIDPRN